MLKNVKHGKPPINKKWKIFNIINSIVILAILGFYLGRMYHYYNLENGKTEQKDILLADKMKSNPSLIDLENGLISNEDGTYTYKGSVTNNYILYSGRVFRALSIDKDNNVSAISEDSQTLLVANINSEYQKSYSFNWLNTVEGDANSGVFANSLNDITTNLTYTNTCLDKVDDLSNIKCEVVNKEQYVSLLSLKQYQDANGAKSFLNNGTNWWLNTTNSNNKMYYVASDGGITTNKFDTIVHNIRPVITFNNKVIITSGSGAKNDPFVIEARKLTTLTDASVGNHVLFSKHNWVVTKKDDTGVTLLLDTNLKVEDKEFTSPYGDSVMSLDTTLGKYLNNDFFNSLSGKDNVLDNEWYNGKISAYSKFNYVDALNSKFSGKVGLLKYGDLFVGKNIDSFILTRPFGDNDTIYHVNKEGILFSDLIKNAHGFAPVIKVNKDLEITSGDGSIANPLELKEVTNGQ
ncbi:MAG: hypothetical protein WBO70_08065 [Erysipelotrichaceae bacterium]